MSSWKSPVSKPQFVRLYFDDGRSRKRWQVRTKGKTQTVRYGRLTGQMRVSEKSFSSPATARQDTEQLIAKKCREGYTQVEPQRLEITRAKGRRKATLQQIKAFEKQIGSKLPEEYRHFLVGGNGGHPNPDCVAIPGMDAIDNVHVGNLFHLQPSRPVSNELTYELTRTRSLLPQKHLPVAGSSDLFTVSLDQRTFGAVYFWFHETEELDDEGNFLASAAHLLASSFDEFLTRIALLYGDDNLEHALSSTATSTGRTSGGGPHATVAQLIRLVRHAHTPRVIRQIEQTVRQLTDLSGIRDGEWPFINLTNPRVLRCLLQAGLHPEVCDSERQALLWQCASSPECVDLLVEAGVDIDRRSGSLGETALMRAIFLKRVPAVKRLLKHGANPTLRLDRHTTQTLKEDRQLAVVLEQAQAKWRKKPAASRRQPRASLAGTSPQRKIKGPKPTIARLLRLMKHDHIQEGEHIEGVEELISRLGDLSSIRDGQWPAIDKFEHPNLLRMLLEAKLNPNLIDKKGHPLLRQCASHPDCINLLIRYGADIDATNGDGETPLMRATYVGDEDCVRPLLRAGANPMLEFTAFAKVMLEMDEDMSALMTRARANWKRKRGKSKASKKRKR